MLAEAAIFMRPVEPVRQMVIAERVVDDELEGPGRGKASADLDQHGDKHDRQPAAIGTKKIEHQACHVAPIAPRPGSFFRNRCWRAAPRSDPSSMRPPHPRYRGRRSRDRRRAPTSW